MKVQCLMNMADESELPSQAGRVFAWSPKKHVILHYPVGRLCIFCWLILDTFRHVLLSTGLTGSSACWNWSFGFPEGAHNKGLPSNPTINTTSSSLVEDWPLVWFIVVHFPCPWSLPFCVTIQYPLFIAMSQFVLKMEYFCCCK